MREIAISKSVAKRRRKTRTTVRKNYTNFEGAYLKKGSTDLAEIWNRRYSIHTENFVFLFRECQDTKCVKTVFFFTPVK